MFDDKDKVPLVASEQRVKQEAVDTEPTQPMPALGNPSFKAPMSSSQHGLWNPLHKWIPSLPVPGLPLAPPLTTAASSLLMPPSAFPWSLVSPSHLKGTSPSSPQPASAPSTVTGSAPQSTRCPTEDAPPTPNESAYQEHVFPKMMLQSSQVHLRIADARRKSSSPDLDDIQDKFIRTSAGIEFNRQRRMMFANPHEMEAINSYSNYQLQMLIDSTNIQLTSKHDKESLPIDLSVRAPSKEHDKSQFSAPLSPKRRHPRKQSSPKPYTVPKHEVKESAVALTITATTKHPIPIEPDVMTSPGRNSDATIASPISSSGAIRPLNYEASRMLNAWYLKHHDHPYPSNETALRLARAGKVSSGQVKKWFANRRRRDGNIKSLRTVTARRRNPDDIETQDIDIPQ